VLVNGETAELDRLGLRRADSIVSGRVSRHHGLCIDDEVLRQRRALGREGLVVVAVVLGLGEGSPRVSARTFGVPLGDEVVRVAERAARAALSRPTRRDGLDQVERVRRSVRQRVGELLGQRPIVEVSITQ
jgi:mRNA degradation ribonuclease J1/J2